MFNRSELHYTNITKKYLQSHWTYLCTSLNSGWSNSTIHLYVHIREFLSQEFDFGHHVCHEFLAPKPWLHCHYQNHICQLSVWNNCLHVCARFDTNANLLKTDSMRYRMSV